MKNINKNIFTFDIMHNANNVLYIYLDYFHEEYISYIALPINQIRELINLEFYALLGFSVTGWSLTSLI